MRKRLLAAWYQLSRLPFALVLVLAIVAFGSDARAAPAEPTESQRYAWDLLMQMTEHLAAQEAYSVNVRGGFDVVQDDGRKIQFVEARTIQIQRPNQLRINETAAEGHGHSVLFDGENITVWDGHSGVYAQAPQPETVDDAILYFIRELGMRLPMAPLLTTWAPVELSKRVQTIDYVELNHAFGRPAHHISARTADLDFQVWISDGEEPLPLRMVLTYHDVGAPQYWAQFADWNLQPEFEPGTFALNLPKGMQQIAFAVQIPVIVEAGADASAAEGEEP